MEISDYIVSESTSIIEVMKQIDKNGSGNIFVCEDGVLRGVVTDGDIRRSIVNNIAMSEPIRSVTNYSPVYLSIRDVSKAEQLMREKVITAIPILNEEHRIVDIKFLLKKNVLHRRDLPTPVVVMAGGKGQRLKPYTDILPKPLIPIGEKTITEHILGHFKEYGYHNYYMIINYKRNFIKAYFYENETENKTENKISFIEEEVFLGTGGGLGLLKGIVNETFFLTNCDILIEADYHDIYAYHKEKKNIITIVCSKKNVVIPYGTITANAEEEVTKLTEKPEFEFKINTGLYVIEPDFLEIIPPDTFIHITDLIQKCIEQNKRVGMYLIDEDSWMDMGQMEELEKMKRKLHT